MSEVERITLSRVVNTRRIDFSEESLEAVDRLTLEDLASEVAVNAACKEFIARVKKIEVESNKPFDVAFTYVRDAYPRLFKLCRLEKTRGTAAVVIVEPL